MKNSLSLCNCTGHVTPLKMCHLISFKLMSNLPSDLDPLSVSSSEAESELWHTHLEDRDNNLWAAGLDGNRAEGGERRRTLLVCIPSFSYSTENASHLLFSTFHSLFISCSRHEAQLRNGLMLTVFKVNLSPVLTVTHSHCLFGFLLMFVATLVHELKSKAVCVGNSKMKLEFLLFLHWQLNLLQNTNNTEINKIMIIKREKVFFSV